MNVICTRVGKCNSSSLNRFNDNTFMGKELHSSACGLPWQTMEAIGWQRTRELAKLTCDNQLARKELIKNSAHFIIIYKWCATHPLCL